MTESQSYTFRGILARVCNCCLLLVCLMNQQQLRIAFHAPPRYQSYKTMLSVGKLDSDTKTIDTPIENAERIHAVERDVHHIIGKLQSQQFSTQSNSTDEYDMKLKNLKSIGHNSNKDDFIMQSWRDFQGLSERALLGSDLTASMQERKDKALEVSYKRCEYVTKLFSKTFHMGTTLMRPEARQHVWAIYAWCRRTDDIVDSPRALINRDSLKRDLKDWEQRLEKIWRNEPEDLFDLALADTVRYYPSLPIQPFKDMIAGMVMDVPGLGQDRYQNFDELYLYCYRVAGTVGLMTLPIFGTADGYTAEEATEPAIALGIGFQLTNILRDVGEDLERGRIYLPLDELRAFGLSEEDIARCEVTPRYRDFMKFQIQRARDYYKIAEEGVAMLTPSARFAVQASLDLYSRILDVIERNEYDNFQKRAFTTKFEKLSILPRTFLKVNSIKPRR